MASNLRAHAEIKKELRGLLDSTKILLAMANQNRSDMRHRVFTDGRKADGSSIGTYSPATIRIKQQRGRFSGKKINLRSTEQLADSLRVESRGKNKVVLGFLDNRDKGTNSALVEDLEKRYGDVFSLTKEEDKRGDIVLTDEINKRFG